MRPTDSREDTAPAPTSVSGGATQVGGQYVWQSHLDGAHVVFCGRGSSDPAFRVPGRSELSIAHLRQIHGSSVVAAAPGNCGDADGLFTSRAGLALCIQTADCVPIVLVGSGTVAALHAGWRGIAGGIIGSALTELGDSDSFRAFIGPAIGVCCYEVGDEVADRIESSLPTSRAIVRTAGRKPRVDLHLAAREQLAAQGVETVERVPDCTRCQDSILWSYRREGAAAGRNLSFVWLEADR